MEAKKKCCLVITTIAGSDHPVLQAYAHESARHDTHLIIAGDRKSPSRFVLTNCTYLSVDLQKAMPFKLPGLLPDHSYAKKNAAYLEAIKNGYEVIIETDDDNLPMPSFWDRVTTEVNGEMSKGNGWINVYSYFSKTKIWPRGFALHQIKNKESITLSTGKFFSPIQQRLVDENPDVDAIYRLTYPLPFYFDKRVPLILGAGSICPFNSQNTTWFKEVFPLLYLPSYCSFRMTDIWRSFVAIRILATCGWFYSFHNASVFQQRNQHDLLTDLEDEMSGYMNNEKIVQQLQELHLAEGPSKITENLRRCYEMLVHKKFLDARELPLVAAWIADLQKISL